ncbi:MAG: hypothetical protein ACOY3Y_09165 [Acidobacteriota bacterium]
MTGGNGNGGALRSSGLTALEAALAHLSTVLVGGSGAAYAVFRYLIRSSDPFSVVNHPWQPAVQHVHVLAAPLLVFALGVVWRMHVLDGVRSNRPRRRSGVTLLAGAAPMIASGVLVQVATEPTWARAFGAVHTLTGLLWLAGYAAHLLGRRAPRAAGAGKGGGERRPQV